MSPYKVQVIFLRLQENTIFAEIKTSRYLMNCVRIYKKLLIIPGLLLVVWLNHNQLTNWHYHVMNNGSVVMHAHPYKSNPIPDTPYQKHHHSSFEYLLLSVLFQTIPLLVLVWFLGLLLDFSIRKLQAVSGEGDKRYGFLRALTLRGPPAFIG